MDPLQQRLRFLAEVHSKNILGSKIEYFFDCKYLHFKNILDLTVEYIFVTQAKTYSTVKSSMFLKHKYLQTVKNILDLTVKYVYIRRPQPEISTSSKTETRVEKHARNFLKFYSVQLNSRSAYKNRVKQNEKVCKIIQSRLTHFLI